MAATRLHRLCAVLALALLAAAPAAAERDPLEELQSLMDGRSTRKPNLRSIRAEGLRVFAAPFTVEDGFGDGPFDPNEQPPTAMGHRPTLQGNGLSLRVNGLDAQSCNECHSIVSHATMPPTLGIGGVGGLAQNAMPGATVLDVTDSSDTRIQYEPGHDPDLPLKFDGVADFNGRFINTPFLYGGGGVELLAKEMTADLQALLADARAGAPGTVTPLDTHGVNFGSITTLAGGQVALDVEGIGFVDNDQRAPEEVLVVRPFGRKGDAFSMRDFDRGAMQFHFGIQPVEVVGAGVDDDGDGVTDEITEVEMSALHVFDVTNPVPRVGKLDRDARRGRQLFGDIGCAECHVPALETRSRFLPLAHPEVPEDPFANVYLEIDLVRVGFRPAPGGGVIVPLFADLKRYDMGPGLAESLEGAAIPNEQFTTARLWGIADTGPYLHDGRATTLREAIEAHGGEALAARDAFAALDEADADSVIAFLSRLRTPRRPNEELIGRARRRR